MGFRIIFFIIFLSVSLCIPAGMKRLTYGFKLAKLSLNHVAVDAEVSEEVREILSQKFRFLARGTQSFAFVSSDDQYVLKLFRFDRKNADTNTSLFDAFQLAEIAKDITGVIYLHPYPSKDLFPALHLQAPLYRPFRVELDSYCFSLQKKAKPLKETLQKALKCGKLSERMDQIFSLLERRIGKKIGNTDPSLWRNFGFLENDAIEIDFGNYQIREDFSNQKAAFAEFKKFTRPLRRWLARNAPDYLDEFFAKLDAYKAFEIASENR